MTTLAPAPTFGSPLGLPPGADSPRLVGPTTQSVLAHDDQFIVIPDVPVFPEHSTEAKDGRKLVFDRAALKALCDSCNRRIVMTGDYATITIGHTVDPELLRAGKAKSPPVVGFAGPFKLGLFGPPGFQRWCLFARFRIYRDKMEEVRQYPRRSPELWLMPTYEQMFLDPIALLSETPRLDMGLLYSAELHAGGIHRVLVEKYAAAAPAAPSASNVFVPSDRRDRYQGESYQGESPMPSLDEIVQAVMQALDSSDVIQWAKQKMQQEMAPAANGAAPAADVNAPPPPAPDAMPPAAAPPAAGPPAPPAPAAAGPASPPPHEERSKTEPEKNAANCAVAPAAPMAHVKYSADDDKGDEGKEKKPDDEPEVQEPEGKQEDEDDDDLEPEANESVEQYRARSRAYRRGRRKGAKMNYAAEQPSENIESAKAKKILEDGHVNGQPLTDDQRKMFGAAASRENYSAEGTALVNVVQAALAPIVNRLNTLDTQLATDRASMKNIERYAALDAMARQGYAINPAEMLEKLKYSADGKGVSDDEFRRTVEILTKTGNRAPIDAPLLPIPESIEQYTAQPGTDKPASNEHRQQAMQLCEKAYETGKRPDYVGTLRNVVSGKQEAAVIG